MGLDTLSKMEYNDIGQLKNKKIAVKGTNQLQSTDYKYNIRGWLASINGGEVGGADNDKFGMILNYESDLTGTNAPAIKKQYNGNISAMMWKSDNDSDVSAYIYSYDDLSRLSEADYSRKNSSNVWSSSGSYDVSDLEYDLNGNIESLIRYGVSGSAIDNLTYSYSSGNQLKSIMDAVGDSLVGDFAGSANTSYSYTYDHNGNMYIDSSKAISDIGYNYLNLPTQVTFPNGDISYSYDAGGVKLRKKVNDDGNISYKHYIGGIEYDESSSHVFTMSIIHTEEGYVDYDNGNYKKYYVLKDHLGNSRIVIKDSIGNTVVQRTDYYPFGLAIFGENNDFKYLYNGKEIQDIEIDGSSLNLYDYGARFYDPQIGRWHVADAMAEAHFDSNPYHYCFSNPILFIDPIGLDTFNINLDKRSVARVAVADSESHTYIISKDGKVVSSHTLEINEFGLVKFPNSGKGFGRYGTEDAGGTETTEQCEDGSGGSETNTGQGDHYLKAGAAAALFGLSAEMSYKPGGARIDYGDMSNEWGQAPWQSGFKRHSTHGGLSGTNGSGVCIDYRYLDGSNRSFYGNSTSSSFNVISNVVFLNLAGKWGFNKNYVSNKDVWKLGPGKATPNGKQVGGHNDHGHLTYTK
jgi:RHS repeat-associated protein